MNVSVARLQTLDWDAASKRLVPWLNLALIALLAFTLAKFFWMLIPVGGNDAGPGAAISVQPQAAAGPNDINTILSMPLFGVRERTASEVPVEVRETQLDLTLTGVFAATVPEDSRALIKDGTGKQRSYAIDDDLPGGAKISAIHADRVILLRNGRYESLRLEPNKSPNPVAANLPAVAPPGGLAPGTVTELKSVREQILQNPSKAGEYIRIQPVYNEGKLQGYRLYPGKNRELFGNLGLQPGELVTSVNGVVLDDPAKSLQMLSNLAQASSITLTLERAGQSRTVNVNLQ